MRVSLETSLGPKAFTLFIPIFVFPNNTKNIYILKTTECPGELVSSLTSSKYSSTTLQYTCSRAEKSGDRRDHWSWNIFGISRTFCLKFKQFCRILLFNSLSLRNILSECLEQLSWKMYLVLLYVSKSSFVHLYGWCKHCKGRRCWEVTQLPKELWESSCEGAFSVVYLPTPEAFIVFNRLVKTHTRFCWKLLKLRKW